MPLFIDRLKNEGWICTSDARDPAAVRAYEARCGDAVRRGDLAAARALVAGQLRALKASQGRLMPRLRSAVSVVADDVAAFAFAQEHPVAIRDWDWSKDFPNLAPPFPGFFIEWSRPLDVLKANRVFEGHERTVYRRAGVLFQGGTPGAAADCPLPGLVGQGVDYAHYLTFRAFAEIGGSPAELGVTGGVLVDRLGRPVGAPVIDQGGAVEAERMFRLAVAPSLLALAFMHCRRGVTVRDEAPPPRLARARERRGRPPITAHKTVVIDGLVDLLRREGGLGANGLKKALHLVRGHFATYTDDAPLMGRFVGTVFRTSHVRGSAARGRVVKGYSVEPGAE